MVESFRDQSDPRLREMRRHLADCLRLVGSVVEFRLEQAAQPEARAHLGWVLDKVTAITLVQRRLADRPDFGPYLQQVADFWQRNSGAENLVFYCRADPVELPPEHSAAIAVIVHELLANSVRHGFPEGEGGRVDVELNADGEAVELVVRDDGAGLAAENDEERRSGLRLVERLAGELDGEFRFESEAGTTARVRLPLAAKWPAGG